MSWELIPESAQSAPRSERPWWALAVVGTVIALIGLALLIWPFLAASRILAFLVGAAFIGNGLAAIVGSRPRVLGAPAGILLIGIGLFAVIFPDFTVNVLVGFVAVVMLVIGTIWLLVAVRMRAAIRVRFVVLPAIVVVLGLAAIIWPGLALSLAAIATGAVTLLIGGSLIAASFAARRGSLQR